MEANTINSSLSSPSLDEGLILGQILKSVEFLEKLKQGCDGYVAMLQMFREFQNHFTSDETDEEFNLNDVLNVFKYFTTEEFKSKRQVELTHHEDNSMIYYREKLLSLIFESMFEFQGFCPDNSLPSGRLLPRFQIKNDKTILKF